MGVRPTDRHPCKYLWLSPKLDFKICTIPGQSKDSSDIEEVGEVINKAGPSKKVGAGDDSDIEELDEAEDEEDDLMGDGEEGEEEEEESEEGKQSYRFPPSIRCLIVKWSKVNGFEG